MANRWCLALASMAVVAQIAAPARAALISHWALDDMPTAVGDTLLDSVGGRDMTIDTGAFFGGGDVLSTTGRNGVADTAVQFHDFRPNNATFGEHLYSTDPNDPNNPFTIVEPANFNGGILGHLGDFMVELWFRYDESSPNSDLWSEGITSNANPTSTGVGGPVTGMEFVPETGDLWFLMITAGDNDPDPQIQPPGGFQTGRWYYAAGVYSPAIIQRHVNGNPIWEQDVDENGDPEFDENGDPVPAVGRPANTIRNGAKHLYIWDGTNLVSETFATDTVLTYGFQSGWHVDNFRLNGNYVTGGDLQALDDFSIFDQAFDEDSFLFKELGIPEPSSLAVLGLGGLLLTRRRRGA